MPWLLAGEEGRGKLRKGPGTCKRGLIRTYPNGATRAAEGQCTRELRRGEPGELKHLSTRRRRKEKSIPLVVAIERGKSLNRTVHGTVGVVGPATYGTCHTNRNLLESVGAAEGDTPVRVTRVLS